MWRIRILLVLPGLLAATAFARGTYQEPDLFLQEVFAGSPPDPQFVWLREERKEAVNTILGHQYPGLRIRYWSEGKRSAWILDEIGKEKPITVGLVVNDNKLEITRVLVFRESRGWEVRHPFFTEQFDGASLADDYHLDRSIDGISGATLSVRALKKLARLALYLHGQSAAANDAP